MWFVFYFGKVELDLKLNYSLNSFAICTSGNKFRHQIEATLSFCVVPKFGIGVIIFKDINSMP